MSTLKDEQKERIKNENRVIDLRIEKIKHKIVIMSGKGGVGKTPVAVNLAFTLATRGFEVGLLDVDITRPKIPKIIGKNIATSPTNTDVGLTPILGPFDIKIISMGFFLTDPDSTVIWRGPLKMRAMRQFISDVNWGKLDFLMECDKL